MEKIYLGIDKFEEKIYLTKHKWDCEWYWAFGYLGNNRCHYHFQSYINQNTNINVHFSKTWLTQDQWWILRDLFVCAYALKNAAECYQYGGHQTPSAEPYRIINKKMAELLNTDLEKILNNIWNLLSKWRLDQQCKPD